MHTPQLLLSNHTHPDASSEERLYIQGQLERVVLRLLAENQELHYYQGLHDVVLTFLSVTGEDLAYAIMSVLVKCHLRLGVTMDSDVLTGHFATRLLLWQR